MSKPVARIHQPLRSAMQSGAAGLSGWVLEFAPDIRPRLDPVTGWSGGLGTEQQLRLRFATRDAAVAYALAQELAYTVEEPPAERAIRPKVYADNFKYGRSENWTH